MRLEGLRHLEKSPTTSSGREPATFRFVVNIPISVYEVAEKILSLHSLSTDS
jgi:hypothetical protein